jgi:hypothetical protein
VKTRHALICCAALTLTCSIQNDASAGERYRFFRSATPNTVLPSRDEVSAVPVPEQGRVLSYPADVVRYGLTVHPGARITRGLFGR